MTSRDKWRRLLGRALRSTVEDGKLSDDTIAKCFNVTPKYVQQLRSKLNPTPVERPREYPCTQCGGDAFLAYTAGEEPGADWGGRVKRGERICLRCFRSRGGKAIL